MSKITIHYSAKFAEKNESYHGEFEVTATQEQIEAQKELVTNIAVGKLREKCTQVWGIDFVTLIKIEVYFYSREQPKEIIIFKKEKQQS